MIDIHESAKEWLAYCQTQEEYFRLQGEEDLSGMWYAVAEEVEKGIKHAIDKENNVAKRLNDIKTSILIEKEKWREGGESINSEDEDIRYETFNNIFNQVLWIIDNK